MPEEILERALTPDQKIALNLVSVNTAINTLQEQVGKHHKVLIEGDGQLPLVEVVRNHESFITSTKFWLRTVAVALVLQTITFGTAAVIYFIKLYPVLEKIANNPGI